MSTFYTYVANYARSRARFATLSLIFVSFFGSFSAEAGCIEAISASSSSTQSLQAFEAKLKQDSISQPTGIELEIDIESVAEYIHFSSERLFVAAREFCQNQQLYRDLKSAVDEEASDKLFDQKDIEAMTETLQKWHRLASRRPATDFHSRVHELFQIMRDDDTFASTVLKLTLFKFLTYKDRMKSMKDSNRYFEAILFKVFPQLKDFKSELRVKYNTLGLVSFLLEVALKDLYHEIEAKLGTDEASIFRSRALAISRIHFARDIIGAIFLDPDADNFLREATVSPPGTLQMLLTIEDRNADYSRSQLTSGIEIHAVSSDTPSETVRLVEDKIEALSLVDSLHTSMHNHVLSPMIPPTQNRPEPFFPVFLRAEHGRRVEMLAHMMFVVEHKQSVIHLGQRFSPLTSWSVRQFLQGFEEYWNNGNIERFSQRDRAFGYVSMTGPGNYNSLDEKSDASVLFGYEFRIFAPDSTQPKLFQAMDDAKWFLHRFNEQDWSTPLPPKLKKYFDRVIMKAVKKESPSKRWSPGFTEVAYKEASKNIVTHLFQQAYYLDRVSISEETGFFASKGAFISMGAPVVNQSTWSKYLQVREAERGYEAVMLFHNWSNDPLFFDQPLKLRAIRRSQRKARKRLLGPESTPEIVRDFLLETGIYEAYQTSIREVL